LKKKEFQTVEETRIETKNLAQRSHLKQITEYTNLNEKYLVYHFSII